MISNAFTRAYGIRDTTDYDDIAIGSNIAIGSTIATDSNITIDGNNYVSFGGMNTKIIDRPYTIENLEVTGNLTGPNVFTIDLYRSLLEKIESLTNTIEALEERITTLEYNPGPGGPKYQDAVKHFEKVKKGEITEP